MPTSNGTPDISPVATDPTQQGPLNFQVIKLRIDAQINNFDKEKSAVAARRKIRLKDETRGELIAQKALQENEHFIPRRVVDQNVSNDVPAYSTYVEQSPVLMNFTDIDNPNVAPVRELEDYFTRVGRYAGWNITWIELADCISLHGGGVVELTLDPIDTVEPTPVGLRLNYVERDRFVIPTETRKTPQALEMVLKRLEYYPWQLEECAEKGIFAKEQVTQILATYKDVDRDNPREIFQGYIRSKGIIHVFYYAPMCSNWLRTPEPLNLGKLTPEGKAAPITRFPFFWCQYALTEDTRLLNIKGRGSKDVADQDAMTHLWTAFVNGTILASQVSGSMVNDPLKPEAPESQKFKAGSILGREVNFNQAQYPPADIVQTAQQLMVVNQASAGQIDYAANNRVDSRKTAAEIKSATGQRALLSSTKLIPFSVCLREAYTMFWEILQSRILFGAGIVKCPPDVQQLAAARYQLTPAGDTEVIKREETLLNLQAFYPLVAATPLGPKVLARIMEMMFPREARTWAPLLETPDPTQLTVTLLEILKNLPPEAIAALDPQTQQNLQTIIANVESSLGQQPNGVAPAPGNAGAPQVNSQPSGAEA
jgi:hypothetical protein